MNFRKCNLKNGGVNDFVVVVTSDDPPDHGNSKSHQHCGARASAVLLLRVHDSGSLTA